MIARAPRSSQGPEVQKLVPPGPPLRVFDPPDESVTDDVQGCSDDGIRVDVVVLVHLVQ